MPQTTFVLGSEDKKGLKDQAEVLGVTYGEGGNISAMLRLQARGRYIPVPREDLQRLLGYLPSDDPMRAKLHTLLSLTDGGATHE